MKILIGNDVDDALIVKTDTRAWAQRLLWFAQEGDMLILSSPPDPVYVEYVTGLTGVMPSRLAIQVAPQGRFQGRLLDPMALLDVNFLADTAAKITDVTAIAPLWASPYVALFAQQLGIEHAIEGAAFIAQNGVEMVNSKAVFRTLAIACGVPIADGAVCMSQAESVSTVQRLLESYPAAMVKMAHSAAGAGNQFVTRDPSIVPSHAGAKYYHLLDAKGGDVDRYWDEYWRWASGGGRFPVVVEEFKQEARSIYAEFFCDSVDATLGGTGELIFEDGILVKEVLNARGRNTDFSLPLERHAYALSKLYRDLGYRGPLSADAVETADKAVYFTEANARFSSSTHLYSVFAKCLAPNTSVSCPAITQHTSPESWRLTSLGAFLDKAKGCNRLFSANSRQGIVPVTPLIGKQQVVFAVIANSAEEGSAVLADLKSAYES